MPKLLQINITANWGSTGKIAESIGIAAMRSGWESYIAYGQYTNASKSNLIHVGSDLDIRLHGVSSRLFDNHGLCSQVATKRFIQQLKQIQPDIIHLHNIHGYYLNYPLLFSYLSIAKIPIIWTLHDCWPFTGHCGFFDYAGCNKWITGCKAACPCKKEYPKSIVLDQCERNWSLKQRVFSSFNNVTLVPVSEWLDGIVKQSFLNKYPTLVIHNGIDLSIFRPQRQKSSISHFESFYKKKIALGVASVWDRRKGLSDFIRLRDALSEDWLIVLVGVTEEQISNLPLGILGIKRTQNQQELAQLYSMADVFVNPTYEDNFPTTNLEAMACGTPVITYLTGGSPEAVSPETGWVVDQGDLASVVRIIEEYSEENDCQIKQRRAACRKRAEEFFDKDKCFDKYIELYNLLLQH